MPRSKQTRFSGVKADPAIDELLTSAVENRAALSKRQKRDRARTKATYDLDPTLQQAIAATSKELDTSASQVVALFMAYALDAYARREPGLLEGLQDRTRSRTPRFSWDLHAPETWRRSVEETAQKQLPTGWRKRERGEG
ncbi:MAG: hypothetical protein D6790_18570 [Caldilineae bacterium]|nr:MAG: hypothetical protein D6790_18570 [Caldilineae bacterium]